MSGGPGGARERKGKGDDGESFLFKPFSPAGTKNPGLEDNESDKPSRTMYVGTKEVEMAMTTMGGLCPCP